jgi:hypothetical protein
VAQTMYTHVSKCKNDKIKERKKGWDFYKGFFVYLFIWPGWLWTVILRISASWIVRIMGVRHWQPAAFCPCSYIVWFIFPLCPLPQSFPPSTPQFQVGPILPLSLILLKKWH